MTIDQAWTDPSDAGTLDLDTDDTVTEVIWDAIMSNIKRLGGTAGPTATAAGRGIEPASGYFMGGAAQDRHVEGGNAAIAASGSVSVTFTNAFNGNAGVALGGYGANSKGNGYIYAPGASGITIYNDYASGSVTYGWVAHGAD